VIQAGDSLFAVTPDDVSDAGDPYLTLVEYTVERVTPTTVSVRVSRRWGAEVRHKIQQRWSIRCVGQSVFTTAERALAAFADREERSAILRRREADGHDQRARWARDELARTGARPRGGES